MDARIYIGRSARLAGLASKRALGLSKGWLATWIKRMRQGQQQIWSWQANFQVYATVELAMEAWSRQRQQYGTGREELMRGGMEVEPPSRVVQLGARTEMRSTYTVDSC
jgi:hypothetical protein